MEDRFFPRLLKGVLAGFVVFFAAAYLTGGSLPFLEFILGGTAAYLVARR